jgi:hypothetical protein
LCLLRRTLCNSRPAQYRRDTVIFNPQVAVKMSNAVEAGKGWAVQKGKRLAEDLGLIGVTFVWREQVQPQATEILSVSYAGTVKRLEFGRLQLAMVGTGDPESAARKETGDDIRSYLKTLIAPEKRKNGIR